MCFSLNMYSRGRYVGELLYNIIQYIETYPPHERKSLYIFIDTTFVLFVYFTKPASSYTQQCLYVHCKMRLLPHQLQRHGWFVYDPTL